MHKKLTFLTVQEDDQEPANDLVSWLDRYYAMIYLAYLVGTGLLFLAGIILILVEG